MKKLQPTSGVTFAGAHRELVEDLRKLEEDIRSGSPATLADLRTRLGATYTHICEHFRFEEQNGYMADLRKREPRLERMVQELGEEHRELRQSLDALHGEAGLANEVDDSLRAKVRDWIERVRRHEARESDLVQNAYDWDFAAED